LRMVGPNKAPQSCLERYSSDLYIDKYGVPNLGLGSTLR